MQQNKIKYPGKRITTDGNTIVSATEALIVDAGVFYPITPSTQMGENFQLLYAKGELNAFGKALTAIETEGEHAAQGGAIALSVTGKRVVNFTSGQGIVYGLEQYYHAPGKLSTMVLEVGARALTKHALNVHCGHDDVYATLDTGWMVLFAKNAQQAADQAIILRKVTEQSLNPGLNAQDGFLTTHLERTFRMPEPALVREFLGAPEDIIECPTEAQKTLFGPTRRRVPKGIDLENPMLLGPVQNQEHYMNGIAARRNNFSEYIADFLRDAYKEYGELTGRHYGMISEYNCENAKVVFVALGSAAENVEAAVDYLKETRGVDVGVIHVNVIRPFPEREIIEALRGKEEVIVLERTDEPLSGSNPLTREIKLALRKAESNFRKNAYEGLGKINPDTEKPHVLSASYGLGSRDFRPEHVIGAYDFAEGRLARQDGKTINDGVRFFYLGIDHPYNVVSDETPSGLPKDSIAVRFHSIGGWGMITTGKNLGSILGDLSSYVAERDGLYEATGELKEVVNLSANPKYGSEKKGAPTNYFLVAAPERVRVNCDLRHVNVVLCSDPKIFLHTDPLDGLEQGGAFIWESAESSPEKVWSRIPTKFRKEIIERDIKLYALNGFDIAKKATSREELQTRMQGNAFLGAFFQVSPFLQQYNIPSEEFLTTVHEQYKKKFGRFGDDVVASNMQVMDAGFTQVFAVPHGAVEAEDNSAFSLEAVMPCKIKLGDYLPEAEKAPLFKMSTFDAEFRAGLGYNQPSSPLSSVGMVASGTGATASKYGSRRQIPIFLEENCTQCMECITVCPDTAMPNTTQSIATYMIAAADNYVVDEKVRARIISRIPEIEPAIREEMLAYANDKNRVGDDDGKAKFASIVVHHLRSLQDPEITEDAIFQMHQILDILPLAFLSTKAIFSGKERKEPGAGGIFSIFINDLCKGCGACVEACGKHEALKMVPETEELHAEMTSTTNFLNLLPDTPQQFLGIYDSEHPQDSKAAALKNHLMVQSVYNALVAGDGACAGCGEKSVLRSASTLTEALMRPIFHKKAERLRGKMNFILENGQEALAKLKQRDENAYNVFRRTVLHALMGYGAENGEASDARIAAEFKGDDTEVIQGLLNALNLDADKHDTAQAIEHWDPKGMSVMAMTAHTGCNSVYGSTPPNNPHPYPWMNSLFQDGTTIGWLIGEGFMRDHALLSVIPERLADAIMSDFSNGFSEDDFFHLTHFNDTYMTDKEILEMPKVWCIGGDGGMGDIGYQNVSKVILQNRPNVKVLMLDTQVYSNTGGQNSDSSPMPGGFDFNQFGAATEGKLTEMKSIAESFMGGHGSPYLARVSMANSGAFYKALLDGLTYRGTAYYEAFTACPPEHGIADNAAQIQAQLVRDSRGLTEVIFDPSNGESYQDIVNIKGNPNYQRDWFERRHPATKERYTYTVAHWALTEARFRRHHKKVKKEAVDKMVLLEDKLKHITQDDVIHRRYLDPNHRAYIKDFGVYLRDLDEAGNEKFHSLSRQMVLFCVERRKAWRLLQSKAGVVNEDYVAQKALLKEFDSRK
jgi:pyruvate-ferredoxin/flavodoxin oxidoreductase